MPDPSLPRPTGRVSSDPGAVRRPLHLRQVNRDVGEDPNSIEALLRDANRSAPVGAPPRPARAISRRSRDFWILALGLNGGAVAAFAFLDLSRSLLPFVAGGCAVVTLALAWILFGVMDRY